MKRAALVTTTLTILTLACGPSRATRTALDEIAELDRQCVHALDALAFAPGPNPDGEARIQAVLVGCQERARAFCTAHHITDPEVCP